MGHDVFISYRHEDQEWADRICQALEGHGISCWIAHRDIPAGADWPGEIMDGLKQSRSFVLVLSSNSVNEEQISREVRIAADEMKLPIFPVRIEDVQPPKKISYFLGDIQWLDAFGGKFDGVIATLVQRIGRLGDPDASIPPTPVRNRPVVSVPQANRPGKSKSLVWIAVAIATVIIIAVIALLLRPSPQPTTISQAGIDAAQRFLNDANAGNFEAAWNQLTPARRTHFNRKKWVDEHVAERNKNGPFSYSRNSCPANTNDKGYTCGFTLTYAGGKIAAANLDMVQDSSGNWNVELANIEGPK